MRRHAKAFADGSMRAGNGRTAAGPRFLIGPALLIVLVAALVLASPALAVTKGVIGSFGSATIAGEYGGELNNPRGVAVNSPGAGGVEPGTTYVADSANLRISVFSPLGIFKEAWGYDVIGINEVQQLTVDAGGGNFTLTFEGKTTGPLAHNAATGTIASALTGLSTIGAGGVTVTGSGENPWNRTITFTGKFRGVDVPQLTTDSTQLTGSAAGGGPAKASVSTTKEGAGGNVTEYETCKVITLCSKGVNTGTAVLGMFSTQTNRIAVDQQTGDVYVGDATLLRVQKFSATGERKFAVGKDVTVGGVTSTEVCVAVPTGCKTGTNGGAGGEFGANMGGIAVVPAGPPNAGNFVVGDLGNRRFQEFTSSGAFVRAFGWDIIAKASPGNKAKNEVQKVTVGASDGTFWLGFNAQQTGGVGTVTTTEGSPVLSSLHTAAGEGNINSGATSITSFDLVYGQWVAGQSITGPGLQAGTVVTVANANGLTISKPALSSNFNVIYRSEGPLPFAVGQTVTGVGIPAGSEILSTGIGTITLDKNATASGTDVPVTSGIPYDAPAAKVQQNLNGLSTVSAGGGSVTVTDGPGDPTGATPYTVTFTGGPLADIDVPQLIVNGRNLGAVTGKTLTCNSAQGLISTKYQWLRNGEPIEGATASTYQLQATDAGKAIQCQTFILNNTDMGGGSTVASVPYTKPAPINTGLPVPPPLLPGLTVTNLPGQENRPGTEGGGTMHCFTGDWKNSPTEFKYQWYISGVPRTSTGATNKDYVVKPDDLKTRGLFQCAVTAINASGAVTQLSTQIFADSSQTNPSPQNVGGTQPTTTTITDLASVATATVGASYEICTVTTECRAGVTGSAIGQFGPNLPTMQGVVVDTTGSVFATDAVFEGGTIGRVQKIAALGAPPFLEPVPFGSFSPPPIGAPNTNVNNHGPQHLTIDANDHLFIQKEYEANLTPLCPNGIPSAREKRIMEMSTDGNTVFDTHIPCAALTGGGSSLGPVGVNSVTGNLYFGNQNNTFAGPFGPIPGERIYIIGVPTAPSLVLNAPDPTKTTAVLSGAVDPNPTPAIYPNPPKAKWQIEYRIEGAPTWTKFRVPIDAGAASGSVPFKTTLTPLLSNTDYEVRLTATKEFNSIQTISPPQSFKTDAAQPLVVSAQATQIREDSAQLNARIDPRGSDTEYFFEWGPSQNYGNVTPITNIGDGQGPVDVFDEITGLSDVTYYFRVVAKNGAGPEVYGENGTFTFHPPNCPNALVRQQTGAGYLPDCRAYELVSPEAAGNSVISGVFGPNSAEATNPSRLTYMSLYAPLPTGDNPPNLFDLYMSTRTESGWTNKYVGLPATDAFMFGGPPGIESMAGVIPAGIYFKNAQVSPAMDKVLLWDIGNYEASPPGSSNAPYVFGPEGGVLDRWPTNVDSIEGGTQFDADVFQQFGSEDLSHFFFMSNIPFIPGAAPTDIYDNDTVSGTLELANLDPSDAKFSGYPIESSQDGSHLLMSTGSVPACPDSLSGNNAVCPAIAPAQFYMRVDGEDTFDVTGGKNGTFAGMTRDGSTVYFLSNEAVMPGELDTSTDLFMWSEATNAVSKVSDGGATGDTDSCSPVESWAVKCGVELISNYERQCVRRGSTFLECGKSVPRPTFYNGRYANQNAGGSGHPELESFLGVDGGEIYFYSPEQLDGEKGAEGMQNLYVFHNGAPQFVTSLDPPPVCWKTTQSTACASGPIGRMQVSGNGDFAAFTATSKLTGANNGGLEAMYRYSVEADSLVCASCPPSGAAPAARVLGAVNGRYLTEDGRTFFSTTDALQSDDTNDALDVYEYVDGRPQLITGGTGETTGAGCEACGTGNWVRDGLIGVSADGRDVYFGTYDVYASNDHNGGNLKIYDARTNGGFVTSAIPLPCQAADECHGPATSAPPKAPQGTSTNLGDRGNEATPGKKKKHKKKKHKKKGSKKKKKQKKSTGRGRNHG